VLEGNPVYLTVSCKLDCTEETYTVIDVELEMRQIDGSEHSQQPYSKVSVGRIVIVSAAAARVISVHGPGVSMARESRKVIVGPSLLEIANYILIRA
jgi:hypothetical protein